MEAQNLSTLAVAFALASASALGSGVLPALRRALFISMLSSLSNVLPRTVGAAGSGAGAARAASSVGADASAGAGASAGVGAAGRAGAGFTLQWILWLPKPLVFWNPFPHQSHTQGLSSSTLDARRRPRHNEAKSN